MVNTKGTVGVVVAETQIQRQEMGCLQESKLMLSHLHSPQLEGLRLDAVGAT